MFFGRFSFSNWFFWLTGPLARGSIFWCPSSCRRLFVSDKCRSSIGDVFSKCQNIKRSVNSKIKTWVIEIFWKPNQIRLEEWTETGNIFKGMNWYIIYDLSTNQECSISASDMTLIWQKCTLHINCSILDVTPPTWQGECKVCFQKGLKEDHILHWTMNPRATGVIRMQVLWYLNSLQRAQRKPLLCGTKGEYQNCPPQDPKAPTANSMKAQDRRGQICTISQLKYHYRNQYI